MSKAAACNADPEAVPALPARPSQCGCLQRRPRGRAGFASAAVSVRLLATPTQRPCRLCQRGRLSAAACNADPEAVPALPARPSQCGCLQRRPRGRAGFASAAVSVRLLATPTQRPCRLCQRGRLSAAACNADPEAVPALPARPSQCGCLQRRPRGRAGFASAAVSVRLLATPTQRPCRLCQRGRLSAAACNADPEAVPALPARPSQCGCLQRRPRGRAGFASAAVSVRLLATPTQRPCRLCQRGRLSAAACNADPEAVPALPARPSQPGRPSSLRAKPATPSEPLIRIRLRV